MRLAGTTVAALCAMSGFIPFSTSSAQRAVDSETGSHIAVPKRARIPDRTSRHGPAVFRDVMAQFARCVVEREYRRVSQAVALPVGPEFNSAIVALATGKCLDNGEMRFSAVVMRGPLFTELYRRRSLARAAGKNWGPAVAPINLAVDRATLGIDARRHLALLAFGKCVVDAQPEKAAGAVLAPTASAEQNVLITKLAPSFSGCVEKGANVTLSKQAVEAILSEVLYRDVEPLTPRSVAEVK